MSSEMLALKQANDNLMLQKANALPDELIAGAERRIIAFSSLKDELDRDLRKVHEQFNGIRMKIKANLLLVATN